VHPFFHLTMLLQHPEETSSKHPVDSGAPAHDSHECPICQVLFAARVNTVAIQLPDPTGWVLCIDNAAVMFFVIRLIRKYGLLLHDEMPWQSTVGDLLFAALLHHVLWRMEWAALHLL